MSAQKYIGDVQSNRVMGCRANKPFYTPNLVSKDINTVDNHREYISQKYKMNKFQKGLFDNNSNEFAYNLHKENKEEIISKSNTILNRKKEKFNLLFNQQLSKNVQNEIIIAHWNRLFDLYNNSPSSSEYTDKCQTIMNDLNHKAITEFIQLFSTYNEIRERVFLNFKLEIWLLITSVLLYQDSRKRSSQKIYNGIFSVLNSLVKNSYYMSLVIIKAEKLGVLTPDFKLFSEFVKLGQSMSFESGIPLIKTLKINNENACSVLKQMLFK